MWQVAYVHDVRASSFLKTFNYEIITCKYVPGICGSYMYGRTGFFQASSESVACAFYQLQTLYQSIRFQILPVQKYVGNINCNISKYFARCSFFTFSRYRWLLTSVVSNWVYIRKNLYKQASSKLWFSVAAFTNFRHTSTLIRRNFLHLDYAYTAYYGARLL